MLHYVDNCHYRIFFFFPALPLDAFGVHLASRHAGTPKEYGLNKDKLIVERENNLITIFQATNKIIKRQKQH